MRAIQWVVCQSANWYGLVRGCPSTLYPLTSKYGLSWDTYPNQESHTPRPSKYTSIPSMSEPHLAHLAVMRAPPHSCPPHRPSFRRGDVCGAIPLLFAHHAHRRRKTQHRRAVVPQEAAHSLAQGPPAPPSAKRPTDSFPSQPHLRLNRLHVTIA